MLVDGRTLGKMKKVELRVIDTPETLINHFEFSTFHGGGFPAWAPKDRSGKYTTVHAYFDNIKVVEGVE